MAALVFALNPELNLFANSVMTETLSIFLELTAFTLAAVYVRSGGRIIWLLATGAAILLAIFVRPTMIVAARSS